MNKKSFALAMLMMLVFANTCLGEVIVTTGGTTGGAVSLTGSPVTEILIGPTTANGGLGGLGGLGGSGGSVGNLSTGSSTSQGGASSSSGNTSGNTTVNSSYMAAKMSASSSYAPANLPTAPCMGSTSVGLSSVLFGFSSGSSWEATECMTLEMARSFSQDGQFDDAQAVRCSSKYAANAPSCIKLAQQRATKKSLVVYVESVDPVTGFKTVVDTRASILPPVRREQVKPLTP